MCASPLAAPCRIGLGEMDGHGEAVRTCSEDGDIGLERHKFRNILVAFKVHGRAHFDAGGFCRFMHGRFLYDMAAAFRARRLRINADNLMPRGYQSL